KLAELEIRIATEKKGPSADASEANARQGKVTAKLINSAALVAFCMKKAADPTQQREDYAAVACAIQNFAIALRQDGWDSKWSTGGLTRDARTYELLGVDQNALEIVGFVF